MSLREHLKRVVSDLTVALEDLKQNPATQILIDGPPALIYTPDLTPRTAVVTDAVQAQVEKPAAPVIQIRKDLPANMSCQLCPDRIYAVRRYLIRGNLPALVLRYNYPIDERATALPDRSDRSRFPTPEEEELFSRMLGAADLTIEDPYYQEFPACHFDPRSLPEEWNRRTENCLKHLRETVERENIRFLLVTGAAAVLLFGDRAKALAESSKIVDFPVTESLTLPCLVVRSPAALIAMERQRLKAEQALERFSDQAQLYQALKSKPAEYRSRMEEMLKALPEQAAGAERVIANVKLKSAASIKEKGKGDANEERFRAAGREGDALLWKLLVLRESELRVKKQIVESLKTMKARL